MCYLSPSCLISVSGARGIWRHFKCKGHSAKNQRYRLDNADFIYTDKLDAIPDAISTELRAEIEKTPPVTLEKMNKFLEDEVDALVGVPSNVPPTTLVVCLLKLLRSGGSQVFLRRLWNQFRTTLLVKNPYASVTWSKTETVVVLVQTLYPRVLIQYAKFALWTRIVVLGRVRSTFAVCRGPCRYSRHVVVQLPLKIVHPFCLTLLPIGADWWDILYPSSLCPLVPSFCDSL